MSLSKDSQSELSHVEHWDDRYCTTNPTQLGAHEWFRYFKDLEPFLEANLPAVAEQPSIVHLGCGRA